MDSNAFDLIHLLFVYLAAYFQIVAHINYNLYQTQIISVNNKIGFSQINIVSFFFHYFQIQTLYVRRLNIKTEFFSWGIYFHFFPL